MNRKNTTSSFDKIPWYYRVSRQLEHRAFTVTPERLGILEGVRAALAVVTIIIIARWLDYSLLSWGAFGAFWTCLVDPGGPAKQRRKIMGKFAVCGSIAAWLCIVAAGYGPLPGIVMFSLIIFSLTRLRITRPVEGQTFILISVVCVVAATFPASPIKGLFPAILLLLGSIYAILLCTIIWPLPLHVPLWRTSTSILKRLEGMTLDICRMVNTPSSQHHWAQIGAAHRHTIRSSLEKMRKLINEYGPSAFSYERELLLIEQIFSAIIAIGYNFSHTPSAVSLREKQVLISFCIQLRTSIMLSSSRASGRLWSEDMLRKTQSNVDGISATTSPAFTTMRDSLNALNAHLTAPVKSADYNQHTITLNTPTSKSVNVNYFAFRVTLAVLVSWGASNQLGLHYSYWAMMAVVVVCQSDVFITRIRGLERLVGSLFGGLLALLLVTLLGHDNILISLIIFPIAAATIAFRAVSYTLFVSFLTPLFVLVTQLLQQGADITFVRIADNALGIMIGISCMLLWAPRIHYARSVLANAVTLNLNYTASVLREGPTTHEQPAARRAAGLSSNDAEKIWRYTEWGKHCSHETIELLRSLRHLAEATTAYALIPGGKPDPEQAKIISAWMDILYHSISRGVSSAQIISLLPIESHLLPVNKVIMATLNWIYANPIPSHKDK